MPSDERVDRRIWWLTVSKAAERSSRMRTDDLESAFAIRRASVTESSAVSVKWPLLKPDCLASSLLYCCTFHFGFHHFDYYTLKNKGASWCHRRTFLSKWFHKEPSTFEEPFCFTKGSLWRNKVLQIIKWLERDGSLKNLWLNGYLWNKKWLF